MQGNLLVYDTKNFLDKYTRFMTKDIYISKKMNQEFLSHYQYLLDDVKNNGLLYENQVDSKKIMDIYQHSNQVLKLHNQKYLKKALSDYHSFFASLYSSDLLDKNKQMMILLQEEELLSIVSKNYIPLIIGKIIYLHQVLQMDLDKIQIFVSKEEDYEYLKREMDIHHISVLCDTFQNYELSCLKENESYLEESYLYEILLDYLVLSLFSDKKHFKKFYHLFANDIYLNKDYQDFDTFKDYHSYLYKRMFLASGLSLKKYIEREAKKRKVHLRTIHNEFVNCKEEVDIANFLYLNSIEYQYDKKNSTFLCSSKNHKNMIILERKEVGSSIGDIITLSIGKNQYLKQLAYELIKRQYPLELRSDEEVYQQLRDTTMDSYFSDLITKILIPSILFYQEHKNFDGTDFNQEQKKELSIIYEYFHDFIQHHSFVSEYELRLRAEEKIGQSNLSYVILLGSNQFHVKQNHFVILNTYPNLSLLNESIKLLYDYKTYLSQRKDLVVPHTYYHEEELSMLTKEFLRENLNYLNEEIYQSKKCVCICFYDEENKLRYSKRLTEKVYQILKLEHQHQVLFSFQNRDDVKLLLTEEYFSKNDRKSLKSDYGIISCEELTHLSKNYDVIVLPYLIKDSYHQNLFLKDDFYQVKVELFVALSKCKNKVYLLCPLSKKDKYLPLFEKLPNVTVMD